MAKECRDAELNRLYEELANVTPGSEKYNTIQEEITKYERLDLDELKVENQFTVDSWKQYGDENRGKRDNLKFWISTIGGFFIAGITLFASETRVMCSDIAKNISNSRIFNR